MDRSLYLLRLEISGIKNIVDPIEISFYKKTITNNFDPEKYKIKAIYGENGSGKTAIITAVKILQNLILDKNYLFDSSSQKILVESVNKRTKAGFIECEFFSRFDNDNKIFKYRVSFEEKDDDRFYIVGETLMIKQGTYSKNPFIKVYEVSNGSLVYLFEDDYFNVIREKTQNLLEQRLLATWVFQELEFGINGKKKSVFFAYIRHLLFFALMLNISIDDADNHSMFFWKERIRSLDEKQLSSNGMSFLNQLDKEVLSSRDETIVRKPLLKNYKENVARMCSFIQIFKPELKDIEVEAKDEGSKYKCTLKMIYEDYSLDKEFESRGIKKLMNLYGHLNAASNGAIVFIDELDSNINDIYLDKIIEHFVYYGKGQLCFTAHNLSPMSVLKGCKNSITFISSINTIHTWTKNGNQSPENAYKNGFIEDSPFNVDAADFLGIIGGVDE